MKNLSIIFLFVLACSNLVYGEFAYIPIEDRVKNSDLIVIGTLRDISKRHTREVDYSKATLTIEKVIFGKVKTTDNLQLKSGDEFQVEWANSNMIACGFNFFENKTEIYFLQIDESGDIEPLSTGSSASIEYIAEVKKFLKKRVKLNQNVKVIKLLTGNEQSYEEDNIEETSRIEFCPLYEEAAKKQKYHPFSALLVILASLSLYYLLYRSRFKIR